MFLDFFYLLRQHKLPVTTAEYLDLLKVIKHQVQNESVITPTKFYHLARHCLVKDIKYYDQYDQAFSQMFSGLLQEGDFKDKLNEWLKNAKQQELSQERMKNALKLPPEDLMKELEKRLNEQKERHDGGNKWIGTGGTSPFGHSGYNPAGIRIGGNSQNRSALVVAGKREYRDYRTDETLNLRQIKMALKELRMLSKKGAPKLSVEKSIKKTCDNGGEIEIVEERERKNSLKLILLMDIGGSMTPHSRHVNRLFSAAHQMNHFKEFHHFYFHNIFYDYLYKDHQLCEERAVLISDLYQRYNPDTRVIIVGDAYMAPYELTQMNGEMRFYYDYFGQRKYPLKKSLRAIERIHEFSEKFPHTVWLNPEAKSLWQAPSIKYIKEQFSMYPLSLDGIKQAVQEVMK